MILFTSMNTRDTFLEPKVPQLVQVLLFNKQEETIEKTFPNVSAVIKRNFYRDDFIKSVKTRMLLVIWCRFVEEQNAKFQKR